MGLTGLNMEPGGLKWPKIGNDKAIDFLSRSLANNKIAQTYVFVGPDDLGKASIALAFARNLQGGAEGFNSDLYILKPEAGKKNISIDAVREFIKMLNLSSFLNSYKIGIVKQAETLSLEAQNALLKTLEEPKEKVVIILLSTAEESLPSTILSRSQILYFNPVSAAVVYDYLINDCGANRSLAKNLADLSLGRPLKALHFLENPDAYNSYLDEAKIWLNIFGAPISDRLSLLDNLFRDKSFNPSLAAEARRLLLIAEGLWRDLLLLSLDQPGLIQHSVLKEELSPIIIAMESKFGQNKEREILKNLKIISQAKEYLSASVNPRLVLEQVALNI